MRPTRILVQKDWRSVIGEILLIVIGVSIALAVDEWRQARSDDIQADEYVDRLIEDFEIDVTGWQKIDEIEVEKIAALDQALAWIHEPDFSTSSVKHFLGNLTIGSRLAYGVGTQTENLTFNELISTGRLGLIKSPTVRRSLMSYHYWGDMSATRIIARQTDYAPTVYRLIPRDPEFQIRSDLSDRQLEQLARRALEYDLEGLIVAERNRARLRREISAVGIVRAKQVLSALREN